MTSILIKIEQGIVTDFEAAWAEAKSIYSADVEPIFKATAQYIETNGAAALMTIARSAIAAALADLASGGSLTLEALSAIAGTVLDEAKSAGLEIAHGAALLVTSMAHAEATATPANSDAPAPDTSGASAA